MGAPAISGIEPLRGPTAGEIYTVGLGHDNPLSTAGWGAFQSKPMSFHCHLGREPSRRARAPIELNPHPYNRRRPSRVKEFDSPATNDPPSHNHFSLKFGTARQRTIAGRLPS